MEETVSSIALPPTAEPLTTTSSANPLVDQIAQKVLLADKGEIALRIESFQKESPPAFVWMQICSYLNPDTIPVSYLERHLPDEEQRGPVTLALTNCGLMLLDEETFSTNELIQRILQKMDPTGAALNKACTLLSEIELDYNDPDVKILNVKSTIWASHAELLLRRADEIQPASLGPLLLQMGTHERVVLKKHEEALEHLMQALEILSRVHGEKHPKVADALNSVGRAQQAMKQHEEARGYFEQSLKITKKTDGEGHPKVADRLINLGNSLYSLKKYDEALICFEQSVAIREAHFGKEHPSVATCLMNIGIVFQQMERYDEALAQVEQSLEIFRKIHGESHATIARILYKLGLMHTQMKAPENAEKCFRHAVKVGEEVLPENHPDLKRYRSRLAFLEISKLQERALQRVLLTDEGEIDRQLKVLQNKKHTAFAWLQICSYLKPDEIPLSYLAQYVPSEGEKSQVVLGVAGCGLMIFDKQTLSTSTLIQKALQKMDSTGEAFIEACALLSKIEFDYHDPDVESLRVKSTIWASHASLLMQRADEIPPASLGRLLLQMGVHESDVLQKHEQALVHLRAALKTLKKVHGEIHPKVADSLSNLGNALSVLHRHHESLSHLQQSLKIWKSLHTEGHPEIAFLLCSMGWLHNQMEQFEKAEECYQQAVSIGERVLAEDHPALKLYRDRLVNIKNSHKKKKEDSCSVM